MNQPLIYLMLVGAVCTAVMTDSALVFYHTSVNDVPALRRKAATFLVSAVGVAFTIITFLNVAKP